MKENFDVKVFATDKYSSNNPSLICRIRNQLVEAIDDNKLMPRAIVVILDRDIIGGMNMPELGLSLICGTQLNWIAREFNRIVQAHKDRLQKKSVRTDSPKFIWMAAPFNINFRDNKSREKFNKVLQKAINVVPGMSIMRMVIEFNYGDSSSFIKEANRFSSDGLLRYWTSVDSAIEHWFTHLAPGRGSRAEQRKANDRMQNFVWKVKMEYDYGRNKFKWTRRPGGNSDENGASGAKGRKLPKLSF